MAFLVALKHYLRLYLIHLSDHMKVLLLDASLTAKGLFEATVEAREGTVRSSSRDSAASRVMTPQLPQECECPSLSHVRSFSWALSTGEAIVQGRSEIHRLENPPTGEYDDMVQIRVNSSGPFPLGENIFCPLCGSQINNHSIYCRHRCKQCQTECVCIDTA